jgi:ABC-type Fe3+-hydroxamate transport system substrate-binding protein
MSTIIKLIFTALVLNACVQAGRSSWTFYQFQDAVQQATLFSGKETPEQLKARVIALAGEHQVPLDVATVTVDYQATQARVKGSYTDEVKLVPGYVYQWDHVLSLDVRRVPY